MPQGEGWGRSPVDPTLAFSLRLALRAVSRLLSEVGIHVLGSNDRETSRDLALVLLALDGAQSLGNTLRSDVVRLLSDQSLDGAVLEGLDLIRAGVESDDDDLAFLAGLLDTRSSALCGEQVAREDGLQIRVGRNGCRGDLSRDASTPGR